MVTRNKFNELFSVRCNSLYSFDSLIPFVQLSSFANESHTLSMGINTRYNGDLLTLMVSGSEVTSSFPTTLPGRPSFLRDLRNVTEDEIGGRFVLELSPPRNLNRKMWSNGTHFRSYHCTNFAYKNIEFNSNL